MRRRTRANEAEQENDSTTQAMNRSSSAPIIIEQCIEQCTEQHRTAVLRWLHDEYVDCGWGFWANHRVVEEVCSIDMFVAISHAQPTAFVLMEKEGIDILCTRVTHQRGGVGRTLARAVIEELWARGLQAITILCSQPESFDFWQRLGFERVYPMEDAHLPFSAHLYRSVHLDQPIDGTAESSQTVTPPPGGRECGQSAHRPVCLLPVHPLCSQEVEQEPWASWSTDKEALLSYTGLSAADVELVYAPCKDQLLTLAAHQHRQDANTPTLTSHNLLVITLHWLRRKPPLTEL